MRFIISFLSIILGRCGSRYLFFECSDAAYHIKIIPRSSKAWRKSWTQSYQCLSFFSVSKNLLLSLWVWRRETRCRKQIMKWTRAFFGGLTNTIRTMCLQPSLINTSTRCFTFWTTSAEFTVAMMKIIKLHSRSPIVLWRWIRATVKHPIHKRREHPTEELWPIVNS